MLQYIARRLLLLPLTLFFIVLVNFIIINLAPGDPTTITEVGPEGGATKREDRSVAFGSDDRYLQFREFYGLTLPILWNDWPLTGAEEVKSSLFSLTYRKATPESTSEMYFKDYDALRIKFGDQSKFVMPELLNVMEDPKEPLEMRRMATRFFIRGGTRQAFLGSDISETEKQYNKKIGVDNDFLARQAISLNDSPELIQKKIQSLREWYNQNRTFYQFEPTLSQKVELFFFETRFFKYMSRVFSLDFGTIRNDPNKTVLSEVTKRFKYSLTLAIIPMILTFFVCQFFGFYMAYRQNRWPDHMFNLIFLILYAIPIFVVAPFLIEKVALNGHFPFTNIPIPYSGFSSPDFIYNNQVSYERLFDVARHVFLPIVAIMYGSLAAEARLSRTAVLEVLRQDYVRTAKAKGVPPGTIMFKHVGRNAAITIVTSLAGSLGIILGGSLIVETLFDINGFGKFFYDAILNRDYNVIMFSTLAGAFLSLMGFFIADIAYTVLDPRITLE